MNVCPNPFFIWFAGRSGSTYLCDLLNSHPDVYCRMEDFGEIRIQPRAEKTENYQIVEVNNLCFFRRLNRPGALIDDPNDETTLEYLYSLLGQPFTACGFKFKYPNQPLVYPEITRVLPSVPGIKVVQLVRENVLKQAISLQNVDRIKEMGEYQSSNVTSDVQLDRIWIDVWQIVSHARYFLNEQPKFREFLRPFENVLTVIYEDLFNTPQRTLPQVLAYLGVDPSVRLISQIQKITPDNLREVVYNYEELEAIVKGTELERFLD